MAKTQITEATRSLTSRVLESDDTTSDELLIGIISPGQGSSGFYSQEVLEAAAADQIFPAGTHMHFDHPTESERAERPGRSVLTLGAVTKEDAFWSEEHGMLVSKATPLAPYRELLTDKTFQQATGLSIVAAADVTEGKVEGRQTRVINKLLEAESIDFVTRAGRGGSILNVLESARPSQVIARAVRHGVEEATANDRREALSTLVRDEHGSEAPDSRVWVWLRDFDDETAWFEVEGGDDAGLFAQAYTADADGIPTALSGDRTEVTVRTTYVPVSPAGQPNTQESAGGHMATTQIEEAELSGLREKAGRVPTLENERDTANNRAELAESRAITALGRARSRVREANADLPAATVDRIVAEATRAGIPATAEGALDETAFDQRVDTAREAEEKYLAGLATEAGAGTIKGFGVTESTSTGVSVEDFDAAFETKES